MSSTAPRPGWNPSHTTATARRARLRPSSALCIEAPVDSRDTSTGARFQVVPTSGGYVCEERLEVVRDNLLSPPRVLAGPSRITWERTTNRRGKFLRGGLTSDFHLNSICLSSANSILQYLAVLVKLCAFQVDIKAAPSPCPTVTPHPLRALMGSRYWKRRHPLLLAPDNWPSPGDQGCLGTA